MSRNINYHNQPFSQAKSQIKPKNIQPLQGIQDDFESFFASLTPKYRAILNVFLRYDNYCDRIWPAQDRIAAEVGCSVRTVNRAFKQFEAWGFAASKYYHNLSKEYWISDWFLLPEIRRILSKFLPALNWLPQMNVLRLIKTCYFEYIIESNSITNIISRLAKKSRAKKMDAFQEDIVTLKAMQRKMMNGENLISSTIRDIKYPKLTERQQIELSLFSDEAILDALQRLKQASWVRDPVRFIYKTCHEFHQREGLSKNWNLHNTLMAQNPQLQNEPTASTPAATAQNRQEQKKYGPANEPVRKTVLYDSNEKTRSTTEILKEFERFEVHKKDTVRNRKTDDFAGTGWADKFLKRIIDKLGEEYARAVAIESGRVEGTTVGYQPPSFLESDGLTPHTQGNIHSRRRGYDTDGNWIPEGKKESLYDEAEAYSSNKPTNANPLLKPEATNPRPSLADIAAFFKPVSTIPPVTTQQREIASPSFGEQNPPPMDANEDYEEAQPTGPEEAIANCLEEALADCLQEIENRPVPAPTAKTVYNDPWEEALARQEEMNKRNAMGPKSDLYAKVPKKGGNDE